ncbi:MAG: glycosyltransferase family 2 protein [Alphaproteobacteria bacterium]|nr:glycosyltransferase family 2 protein [Alphaproteobacteria bacterium]
MDKCIYLSICIPTYNGEKYIKHNIDNILQQIAKDKISGVEIVISDNCSTDNTKSIVNEYIRKHPKIIRYSGNILKCCELAKGKYIHFLGDDDFYCENGLKKIITLIKADTSYSLINLTNNFLQNEKYIQRTEIEKEAESNDVTAFLSMCGYHFWCCSNIVVKADYAKKFLQLNYSSEWLHLLLALYCLSKGHKYYTFCDKEPIVTIHLGEQTWLNYSKGPSIYTDHLKTLIKSSEFGITKKQINLLINIFVKYVPINLICPNKIKNKLNLLYLWFPYLYKNIKFYTTIIRSVMKKQHIKNSVSNNSNNYPNLDVFVLTYNRANYLKTMLESLCKQTASGFIIKILDNASTDETDAVINMIQKEYTDRNIVHIKNDTNIGNPKNFQKTQILASNEYTAVFHDDDVVHPQFIETAMKLFNKHPNAVMASCSFDVMYNPDNNNWPSLNKSYYLWNATNSANFAHSIQRWCFAAMIYKTSAYTKCNYKPELFGKVFDLPFLLDISSMGDSIIIRGCGLRYRQHTLSDSNDISTHPKIEQLMNLLHHQKGKITKHKTYNMYCAARGIYNWVGCLDISFNDFLRMCKKYNVLSNFQYRIIKSSILKKIFKLFYNISRKYWRRKTKHNFN